MTLQSWEMFRSLEGKKVRGEGAQCTGKENPPSFSKSGRDSRPAPSVLSQSSGLHLNQPTNTSGHFSKPGPVPSQRTRRPETGDLQNLYQPHQVLQPSQLPPCFLWGLRTLLFPILPASHTLSLLPAFEYRVDCGLTGIFATVFSP